VDGAQRLVIESVTLQVACLEVLDQHVRVGGEPADQLLALRLGHVDRDGALGAVGREESRTLVGLVAGPVLQPRALFAQVVAGAGALHLDHVGAEIPEDLGGPGPGEYAAQVQHPDVRQDCIRHAGSAISKNPLLTTTTPRSATTVRKLNWPGASFQISTRRVSPGNTGAEKRPLIARTAAGSQPHSRFISPWQVMPKVASPCRIGRSKPAARATAGLACKGLKSPDRR